MRASAILLVGLTALPLVRAQHAKPTLKGARSSAQAKTPARVEKQLTDAKAAQSSGRFEQAVEGYQVAKESAKASKAPHAQADAAIQSAIVLEQWAQTDETQKPRLTEAVRSYQEAIDLGAPPQKQKARNNLAVLHLREGRAGDAVRVFAETDFKAVDPKQVHLYRYNYGRALEKAGETGAALQQYGMAAEANLNFDEAIEAAFRVAPAARPAPVEEMARLADRLIEKDRAALIAKPLLNLYTAWAPLPNSHRVLASLVRCWAALRVGPEQFSRAEIERPARGVTHLLGPVNEVIQAYALEIPQVSDRAEYFPNWNRTEPMRKSMSELLFSLADGQAQEQKFDSALKAYYAAWRLSPGNTEAAIRASAVVRQSTLPPAQRQVLLAAIIRSFFVEKNAGYARGDELAIIRMHSILGSVFEQEKLWGNGSHPNEAMWHWLRAVEVDAQLRSRNPGLSPSPGIHKHLAECYRRRGALELARAQYLAAAQGFVELGNEEGAAEARRLAANVMAR